MFEIGKRKEHYFDEPEWEYCVRKEVVCGARCVVRAIALSTIAATLANQIKTEAQTQRCKFKTTLIVEVRVITTTFTIVYFPKYTLFAHVSFFLSHAE